MNLLSHTEENYLKAIYSLYSSEKESINTNEIAEVMQTSAASVSDMLKKLAVKDFVDYQKYKGVQLTPRGKSVALQIIRKHRLWEVFLVNKLQFTWDEVHDIAEQLEHIQSSVLIDKLDAFLEFPQCDPHGEPIPDAQGNFTETLKKCVKEMKVGEKGLVIGVQDSDSAFLKYMNKLEIGLGTKLEVLDIIEFDQSVEIEINGLTKTVVSKNVSENIYVQG
jgi:DtxR family Mn-dependent transcriptional regulator